MGFALGCKHTEADAGVHSPHFLIADSGMHADCSKRSGLHGQSFALAPQNIGPPFPLFWVQLKRGEGHVKITAFTHSPFRFPFLLLFSAIQVDL
jgi:hypothetical protein